MRPEHPDKMSLLYRAAIGSLLLLGLMAAKVQQVHAASVELIPSFGVTRAKGGDEVKPIYGLALRSRMNPLFKGELGVQYRQDSDAAADLTIRTWPITGSLWLTPGNWLYLGGGVGWYNTTYHYGDNSPFKDKTTEDFGVHLGGGVEMPLSPSLGLDLGGRYVFLPKGDIDGVKDFNPSFWSTSAGLALHF